MIDFGHYKNRLIKMTEPYPIYDREDDTKIIGYTKIGDMAVITYSMPTESYHEVVIVSGEYTGVDTLALDNNNLAKAVFIINKIDNYGHAYIRGKKVACEYV